MARIPVAELRVQTQGPGLVRVTANAPAKSEDELQNWVHRTSISSNVMVTGGLALAAAGGIGTLVMPVGIMGVLVLSSMITIGGGVAFLGLLKRRGRKPPPEPTTPALPASAAAVIAERARRVQSVLGRGGDFTFERLLAELKWTESALLETLLAMKDANQIVEDLDLDTGEWVYRMQVTEYGSALPAGAMTLADRQAAGLGPGVHS